jgi:hypothetical protein
MSSFVQPHLHTAETRLKHAPIPRYCTRPLEGRVHVTLRAAIPIRFACTARRTTRVLRGKHAQNASNFRWVCTVTICLICLPPLNVYDMYRKIKICYNILSSGYTYYIIYPVKENRICFLQIGIFFAEKIPKRRNQWEKGQKRKPRKQGLRRR